MNHHRSNQQMQPSPLLDLFGAFFAKLTDKHPHKDLLQKELAEFKSLLTANPPSIPKVNTYLESLSTKSIIPANSLRIQADNGNPEGKTVYTSPKYPAENPLKNNTPSTYTKKVEIVPLLNFLKYRRINQADKNQVLLSRYTHVQTLEKNANNLYRAIAVYYFTLVMRLPGSEKKISDIIDDVASKRIELYCPVEKLTHDDICGVFCGFFSQLIRLKRQQETLLKILQTFHEMAGTDKAFSVGLASFVKSKIFAFVEQKNFPYEIISFKSHMQSKAFKEKVENNDHLQLENVLRLVPFVFEKQVVLYSFENGKMSETTFKAAKPKKSAGGEVFIKENNDLNTIYLLVEKVFSMVSIFGLLTASSSPLNVSSKSLKSVSANAIPNKDATAKTVTFDTSDSSRKYPKVWTLTIDAANASTPTRKNTNYQTYTPNSYSALPASRLSLQDYEKRYKTPSSRLSYNPTQIKTPSINSSPDIDKSKSEEKPKTNYSTAEKYKRTLTYVIGEAKNEDEAPNKQTSPKRVAMSFESHYLASKEMISTEPDVTNVNEGKYTKLTPNRNISMNMLNPVHELQSQSTKENDLKTDSPVSENKSSQPASNHVKTASFGSYQSLNPLSSDSGRNSTNYQTSEESATLDAKKLQIPATISPVKTEMPPNYSKSSFGGKYYDAGIGNETKNENKSYSQGTNSEKIPRVSEAKPETNSASNRRYNEQNDSQHQAGSKNVPTTNYSATYQSKEKLKSIINVIPKGKIDFSSTPGYASSTNSPSHKKSGYSTASKYATNTSYNYGYKPATTNLNMTSTEQFKDVKKYEINPNYSYQGRTSTPAGYRPSYTTQANNSQNNSFSKDTATSYKPNSVRTTRTTQTINYSSPYQNKPAESTKYSKLTNAEIISGN